MLTSSQGSPFQSSEIHDRKLLIHQFMQRLFLWHKHPMAYAKMKSNMDMMDMMERFGTERKCRVILEDLRWPDGIIRCPRCNGVRISRIYARAKFDCDACRYQFSVTAGTILHDTHLSLRKWLFAIYLKVESKNGMSVSQMKRVLGVSYKTAWYLCHRLHLAMAENEAVLSGTVELDGEGKSK